MLKSLTVYILLLFINLHTPFSQPWHYDFGTGSGSITSGSDSSLLPSVPSGFYKIRIGTGSGEINLNNATLPFSTGSFLRMSAPTNASVNKFVVYDFNATKAFTMKSALRFGASDGLSTASNGTWYYFAGDGASFIGNVGFTSNQIFAGLQFIFGASGTITANYRNAGGWTLLTGTPFQQGQNYVVELYGNNTTSVQNYTYGGPQTVAANKWDLWLDGILIGDELSKGQIANNVNVDSWMFYGESSTTNAANIFLDEIDYTNEVSGSPLPVTMNSFDLQSRSRSVVLNWSTSSEINNSGFDIERGLSTGSGISNWQKIGFIQGKGTTSQPEAYTFEDKELNAGQYYYRLKQIDYNGNFEYFIPSGNPLVNISKPAEFMIKQNYPNPSNPISKIDYQVPFDGNINLTVYDITGKTVIELVNGFQKADYYSVTFDGSTFASGIYFYRITGNSSEEKFTNTLKMIIVK
ncbi:MAG: T9SS type A sorting domain-containing protein [Ignavibacteria bacterium]